MCIRDRVGIGPLLVVGGIGGVLLGLGQGVTGAGDGQGLQRIKVCLIVIGNLVGRTAFSQQVAVVVVDVLYLEAIGTGNLDEPAGCRIVIIRDRVVLTVDVGCRGFDPTLVIIGQRFAVLQGRLPRRVCRCRKPRCHRPRSWCLHLRYAATSGPARRISW